MMKWGFRWYGEKGDSIPLNHVRQIPGMNGIVGTLLDKLPGDVWEIAEINELKESIEKENEELVRLGKQLKRIPKYASMSQITEKVLEDEKELLKEELKKQGKPEKIWDKILPGQIERFIKDNTLIDQQFSLQPVF